MKQLVKCITIVTLLAIVVDAYSQDIEKVRTTLTEAREAYDGGNYRTAISKVKEVEQLVGSTTKPATSYIKIMSYYKLKEYVNCVEATTDYMKDNPVNDETWYEIIRVCEKALDELEKRDNTMEWLARILKEYFYFQKDLRIEVRPCQITFYYTRVKNKENIRRKEVYPTKFNKIHMIDDNDYTISYSGKNISETNLDTGNTIYYADGVFLFPNTPSDIVRQIEQKIKYLNTFCEE